MKSSSVRRFILILIALCSAQLSGCASLITSFGEPRINSGNVEWDKKWCSSVYIGVRTDASILSSPFDKGCRESSECGMNIALSPFALIDLPFSLVVDTLLLPYTIPKSMKVCP